MQYVRNNLSFFVRFVVTTSKSEDAGMLKLAELHSLLCNSKTSRQGEKKLSKCCFNVCLGVNVTLRAAIPLCNFMSHFSWLSSVLPDPHGSSQSTPFPLLLGLLTSSCKTIHTPKYSSKRVILHYTTPYKNYSVLANKSKPRLSVSKISCG